MEEINEFERSQLEMLRSAMGVSAWPEWMNRDYTISLPAGQSFGTIAINEGIFNQVNRVGNQVTYQQVTSSRLRQVLDELGNPYLESVYSAGDGPHFSNVISGDSIQHGSYVTSVTDRYTNLCKEEYNIFNKLTITK